MFSWNYLLVMSLSAVTLIVLGRKWQLKPRHYLGWLFLMLLLESATLALLYRAWPSAPAWLVIGLGLAQCYILSLLAILYCFFRDPERKSPGDNRRIVSPADGTIIYIKTIENGRFPFAVKNNAVIPLHDFTDVDFLPEQGLQIGIAMNFLNVHVNRSPIAGTIRMVRRIPGKFASLKHVASLLENERVLMMMECEGIELGIVQIASRLVRRIVPYVVEGDCVAQGQRVGVIRFGSQVDLLLPAYCVGEVIVQIGDEVTAGESVLVTCSGQMCEARSEKEGGEIDML